MSTLTISNLSDGTETVETTYITNGSGKAWGYNILNSTDSSTSTFNISSFTDVATGRTDCTLTNAMSAQQSPTVSGGTSAYPYQVYMQSASVFRVNHVNSSGNYSDGGSNAVQFGDLA